MSVHSSGDKNAATGQPPNRPVFEPGTVLCFGAKGDPVSAMRPDGGGWEQVPRHEVTELMPVKGSDGKGTMVL